MAPFTLTPVERGIMRCRHSGSFAPEEIQALATFLRDYRGKLLVDLAGSDVAECAMHIRQLRPMMPVTAVVGPALPAGTLEIDRSYYAHDVRWFEAEEEALTWLRNF